MYCHLVGLYCHYSVLNEGVVSRLYNPVWQLNIFIWQFECLPLDSSSGHCSGGSEFSTHVAILLAWGSLGVAWWHKWVCCSAVFRTVCVLCSLVAHWHNTIFSVSRLLSDEDRCSCSISYIHKLVVAKLISLSVLYFFVYVRVVRRPV
jgi:hypothetical protein